MSCKVSYLAPCWKRGKLLNKKTGRYVKPSGKIGKSILSKRSSNKKPSGLRYKRLYSRKSSKFPKKRSSFEMAGEDLMEQMKRLGPVEQKRKTSPTKSSMKGSFGKSLRKTYSDMKKYDYLLSGKEVPKRKKKSRSGAKGISVITGRRKFIRRVRQIAPLFMKDESSYKPSVNREMYED